MRNLRDYEVERYRIKNPARLAWVNGWEGDETCGAFDVPSARGGNIMVVIATSGEMWDHVSVSLQKRCPTWYEMEQVARLFFLPNEVAMQLHVPARDHVNCHPNCLHWWRSHDQPIPLPPKWMVGPDENARPQLQETKTEPDVQQLAVDDRPLPER